MLQAMVQPMVHPMVPPRLGHVDVAAEAVRRLGTGQEAKATTVVVRLHHTWKLKVGARGKLRICFLEARCEPWCWIWCWIFFFHTARMAQFCRYQYFSTMVNRIWGSRKLGSSDVDGDFIVVLG